MILLHGVIFKIIQTKLLGLCFSQIFLCYFKPINYDRWNHKALDHCHKWLPNVQKYVRAFLELLLWCEIHVSDEKALHHFQASLWDEKLKFLLWFSSLQAWKLHVKLPTGLVTYWSTCKARLQTTNARAKADTATKMLWILPITSIFHTSNGSNHRTQKDQVL